MSDTSSISGDNEQFEDNQENTIDSAGDPAFEVAMSDVYNNTGECEENNINSAGDYALEVAVSDTSINNGDSEQHQEDNVVDSAGYPALEVAMNDTSSNNGDDEQYEDNQDLILADFDPALTNSTLGDNSHNNSEVAQCEDKNLLEDHHPGPRVVTSSDSAGTCLKTVVQHEDPDPNECSNPTFKIGDSFRTFAELEKKLKDYEAYHFVKFWKREAQTIEAAAKHVNRYLNPHLKYYQLYMMVKLFVPRAKVTGVLRKLLVLWQRRSDMRISTKSFSIELINWSRDYPSNCSMVHMTDFGN